MTGQDYASKALALITTVGEEIFAWEELILLHFSYNMTVMLGSRDPWGPFGLC
ncbi:MAG: hypothetical protein KDB90_14885 [Planctomycetes bacterium]|nr:hypothetical protein [Planctomycetota bacterium]